MKDWKLKTGRFLFKHRSFTPIPLILLVLFFFKPADLREKNTIINASGLLISLLGEIIRIAAVGYSFSGTSGRESYLRADRLNTTGIYSIVRNPLYIGNFFIFTGLLVIFANIAALVIFAVFLILQYYLIISAEEDFLKEQCGPAYGNYCRRVRRIIPSGKNYQKNQNPFSPGKVLFEENDSIFNLLMMLLLVFLYKENTLTGTITSPILYIVPGAVLITAYVTLKIIKKKKK